MLFKVTFTNTSEFVFVEAENVAKAVETVGTLEPVHSVTRINGFQEVLDACYTEGFEKAEALADALKFLFFKHPELQEDFIRTIINDAASTNDEVVGLLTARPSNNVPDSRYAYRVFFGKDPSDYAICYAKDDIEAAEEFLRYNPDKTIVSVIPVR